MISRTAWRVFRGLRKVWVRVVAFALLAVVSVAVSGPISAYVPLEWAGEFDGQAVDQVLTIMASSMLAVTTFSLSIAVSAFAAAANSATPRATKLLQEDDTTQNVLATFLGAFLFSLLGLIAVKAGLYSDSGRITLFLTTLVVILAVVVALLRWISHLMEFGRMGDTLARVEEVATEALKTRMANPYLRGVPLKEAVPGGTTPVLSDYTGYVQHVDIGALCEWAERNDRDVFIDALPGTFVHGVTPLCWVEGEQSVEDDLSELSGCFTMDVSRTFDQDPRFGLIVLSEIASRSLSPAVNDPGTAISVIGALVRVLGHWDVASDAKPHFPRVHVPAIAPKDLFKDAFRPIARDGADLVEVQLRLLKMLTALAKLRPDAFHEAAQEISDYAWDRVKMAKLTETERDLVDACRMKCDGAG